MDMSHASRFIFVIGGVMSGVGKGVATASIAKILASRGFSVTAVKIDPYINVDAGTMNPLEHGEVFVTNDGTECDQDIGNYERFLGKDMGAANYMTTGQVYETVIHKERQGEWSGKTVEVVPHIPEEVIARLTRAARGARAEITMVEIGGTVGEYQNLLFLEAARMMKLADPGRVLFVLVSYLPVPHALGEMKTKPTQHATRALNSAGIQPDLILARAAVPLDEPRKQKLSQFCNVSREDVISAPHVESVYQIPLNFERDHLSDRILSKFRSRPRRSPSLLAWKEMVRVSATAKNEVRIGIVGKYFGTGNFQLSDAYLSVIEAVKHASWFLRRKPAISWLDAEAYEKNPAAIATLKEFDGIIVPGGFGERGVEGKIRAISYCRKTKKPYLGLCYGMQLATVEFARNACGLAGAHTTEIDKKTPHPVIHLMPEQERLLHEKRFGGSMRLGAYRCRLEPGTLSKKAYRGTSEVTERHRHRYELNNAYRETLERKGLVISGINPERGLVEIIELKKHPFFVGTQFHPELKSRPLEPHPLFTAFIRAAIRA